MNAYEPPKQFGDARPAVLLWYRAYCGLMALAHLLVLGLGIVGIAAPLGEASDPSMHVVVTSPGPDATSIALLVLSLGLASFFVFSAFVPLKPWGWSVGFGAILLGLVSLCLLPMALPLLIHWWKPKTKAAFGRPPI